MLGWPEVRGVAEVMDMHGVLHGSERMQGDCPGRSQQRQTD